MDLLDMDSLSIEQIDQKIQEINKKLVIAWGLPGRNTVLHLQAMLSRLTEIKNHKTLLQNQSNSKAKNGI